VNSNGFKKLAALVDYKKKIYVLRAQTVCITSLRVSRGVEYTEYLGPFLHANSQLGDELF
jgi:hypothetical protein